MESLRKAVRNPTSVVQNNQAMRTQIQLYHDTLRQVPQQPIPDDPFLMASKLGRPDIVKAIIDFVPANLALVVEQKDPDGFYAVHFAAANGHEDVVRVLLEKKADQCRYKDRKGWTPLHHAIANSWIPVILVILRNDFTTIRDLTLKDETCLNIAVKHKRCKEFKVLLNHLGYDEKTMLLNRKDKEGNHILHIAVSDKLLSIVEDIVLMAYAQLNINIENADGLTALNLCDRGEKDVILERILRKVGGRRTVSLIAIIDPFLHATSGERQITLLLPSGVVLGALALLGNPLEGSTSQSAGKEEVHILDVLKGRHHSFWRIFSALSLTILFVFSILILLLSLWSVPTRMPLIGLLLLGMIYYCIALAYNMSSFTVIYGSLRIRSCYLVGVGTLFFYLIATLPLVLGTMGKRLKRLFWESELELKHSAMNMYVFFSSFLQRG